MDDEEPGADPVTEICQSGLQTCDTGGDLDRRRELRVGVAVVSELIILAQEQSFEGFLFYGFLC